MSELNDGEVQTIFTSPPYWNKRTYSKEEGLGNEKTSRLPRNIYLPKYTNAKTSIIKTSMPFYLRI